MAEAYARCHVLSTIGYTRINGGSVKTKSNGGTIMYEIIGINYERATATPSTIRIQRRTPEALIEVYNHGKSLWDGRDCSKYLVALIFSGKMVDYNQPDYWNFEKFRKFVAETMHFSEWDYAVTPCPYKDRKYHDGEAQNYMTRMCNTYQNILKQEGLAL